MLRRGGNLPPAKKCEAFFRYTPRICAVIIAAKPRAGS